MCEGGAHIRGQWANIIHLMGAARRWLLNVKNKMGTMGEYIYDKIIIE
jgi:hypothetical protein